MRTPALLAAILLAALGTTPAYAQDRLTLRLQAGPTYVHGSSIFGGTTQLALDVGFGRMFGLEVFGGGAVLGSGRTGRANLRFGLGLRLGARRGATRPYFSARAAHMHDAPLQSFHDHPGQALSGDPSYGLGHVTLAGGALGVVFAPEHHRHLRANVEVESLAVAHAYSRASDPTGLAPRAYTSLQIGVGWAFR